MLYKCVMCKKRYLLPLRAAWKPLLSEATVCAGRITQKIETHLFCLGYVCLCFVCLCCCFFFYIRSDNWCYLNDIFMKSRCENLQLVPDYSKI